MRRIKRKFGKKVLTTIAATVAASSFIAVPVVAPIAATTDPGPTEEQTEFAAPIIMSGMQYESEPLSGIQEENNESEQLSGKQEETVLNVTEFTQIGNSDCEYGIDEEGVLTIQPMNGATSGTLPDGYTADTDWPWYDDAMSIKAVKFNNTVKAGNSTAWMFSYFTDTTSFDFTGFDTSAVTNMRGMFDSCNIVESLDLSNFNTSNVTDMSEMFLYCFALKSLNLSSFDTSKVTDMNSMFAWCKKLTSLDLKNFKTLKVKDMSYMFGGCYVLTSLDISSFNTFNVTNMEGMFNKVSKITSLNLLSFKTANVTNMRYMFSGCKELVTVKVSDSWSVRNVTFSDDMFANCGKLVGGKGTEYNSDYTDATYARIDKAPYKPGYFTEGSIVAPEVATLAYNGTAQQLISTGGTIEAGKTMYYRLGRKGTWTDDYSDITATKPDSYTIYYGYKSGMQYKELGSVKATISKAELTKDILNIDCPTDPITYDRKAHGAEVTLKSPYTLGGGAKLSIVYVDESGTESTKAPVEAGSYTVVAKVPETATNIKSGSVEVGTITIKVAIANLPVVATPIYKGTAQKLISSGGSIEGGKTMYYRLGSTGAWTYNYNAIKATNADSYTVFYGYKNGTGYKELGTVKVSVNKAELTKDMLDINCPANTITYDGKAHAATATLKTPYTLGGSSELSVVYVDEYGTESVKAPVEIGSYKVKAVVPVDAVNFEEGSVEIGTIKIIEEIKDGWKMIGGNTYYYKDGNPLKGWQTIDGKRYWFDKNNGVMHMNDWYTTEYGNKYYVGSDGVMVTGWQTIDGKRYWFDKEVGRMQRSKWYTTEYGNKYYVGSDGVMVTGWQTIDGERYWFNSSGQMQKNKWYTTEYGNKYYVLSDGKMARNGTWNLKMENGSTKKCTFNSSGRLISAV